jgi:hypothetical protein
VLSREDRTLLGEIQGAATELGVRTRDHS